MGYNKRDYVRGGDALINLPAIFIANGTAIMLLIILLLSSHKNTRYGLLDDKIFYAMVACTILQCFIESAAFYIDGKILPGYHTFGVILNAILYIANICFAFMWTIYADFKVFSDRKRLRRIYPFVGIPAFLISVGSIVNLFTPVFFHITENNIYQRTGLYIIPYIFTYLYLAYGVVLIYCYRNKVKKYLFLPAIIFMVPILLGSLLQFFFYGLSLVWIGVAVALVSLYVNVQNEASCIDVLSGLYNRQYLNHYLYSESKRSNSKKMLAGILLDVDHFKHINDEFGHLVGDDAIASAGDILRNSVSEDGLATRFAGDEFVVVKLIEDEQEVIDTLQRIEENTKKFNEDAEKDYQLQFSMGYSIYDRKSDSIDTFLSRMDGAMYAEKRKKRM
ncbi:MAG: diguanylate cyclase [Clostridia bacterium]|nr:diguanylate cyclase [Clostridia bacterium]NCD03116.1 diguanylate cyclase [Clostridia bacterium]